MPKNTPPSLLNKRQLAKLTTTERRKWLRFEELASEAMIVLRDLYEIQAFKPRPLRITSRKRPRSSTRKKVHRGIK